MELVVIGIIGLVGLWLLKGSQGATVSASIVTQASDSPSSSPRPDKPSGIYFMSPPTFGVATCGPGLHTCLPAASAVPVVAAPPIVQPTPQPNIINSTTGQDLTTAGVVDTVPSIGKQPANTSAWTAVFSSPGVWRWSLISDPSVSFMADISGHRIS